MSLPVFMQDPSNELAPGTGIFLNYPYQQSSAPQFSVGDSISQVGDYAWDGIKGVWVDLKNEIRDVGTSAVAGVDNILWAGFKYVLLLIAGVAVLVYVLGKSGTKIAVPGFKLG